MRALAVLSFTTVLAIISACDVYESRRLEERLSDELGQRASIGAQLQYKDDYGNFEEGGDVSLFQLTEEVCSNLSRRLGQSEEAHKRTRYYDTFAQVNVSPKSVHKYVIYSGTDSVMYVLDAESCVIYRDAHFE